MPSSKLESSASIFNKSSSAEDSSWEKVDTPVAAAERLSQTPPSSQESLLVLSAQDVSQVILNLPLDLLLENQASAFASFSSSRASTDDAVQAPPRASLTLPDFTTLVMPCHDSTVGTAVKIVSVPRADRPDGGLPGSNVLIDEASGRVVAICRSDELTGVRTAAGSTVATKLLVGKQGSSRKQLVVFGAGVQAFCGSIICVAMSRLDLLTSS